MSRGIEQRLIFRDARDRYHFVDLLPRMRERFAAHLYAYVLMENHYHLLLQTPEPLPGHPMAQRQLQRLVQPKASARWPALPGTIQSDGRPGGHLGLAAEPLHSFEYSAHQTTRAGQDIAASHSPRHVNSEGSQWGHV